MACDFWEACLISSGHGNSHLLLGAINREGPYTVSTRAQRSQCTMKDFWIFNLLLWCLNVLKATFWSNHGLGNKLYWASQEDGHLKRNWVPTWWTVSSISTGMIKSALCTGCWKHKHKGHIFFNFSHKARAESESSDKMSPWPLKKTLNNTTLLDFINKMWHGS